MSLNARALLAVSLVLAAFLGLTGLTLDGAFRHSLEEAAYQRLEAQVYGLLAAAELGADGRLSLPVNLPDERFGRPGSGLYALVVDAAGNPQWQSPSLLGRSGLPRRDLEPGTWARDGDETPGAMFRFIVSLGVAWVDDAEQERRFTLSVAEGPLAYQSELQRFRTSLWAWLGGVAVLLLLVQLMILRWSLAPLRRVERELGEVEAGHQSGLSGDYPRELSGLTAGLNALLDAERRRLTRYRDALGDLAHSLKTPLAVLRGAGTQANETELREAVREQGERMTQIVDYQLQKAATSGRTALMQPIAIEPMVRRLVATLDKVYREHPVEVQVDIPGQVHFRGDEGDLMELFGTLLDNAFKWSRGRIRITVHREAAGISVAIDDDGPGIPGPQIDRVRQRGGRLDHQVDGQGIGLAVATGLVEAYGGTLDIRAAPIGGARIAFRLQG